MDTAFTTKNSVPDGAKRRRWKLELIGGIALLGVLTLIVVVISIASKKNPTQKTALSTYPGIPQSFTDFSGKVTAINGNIIQAHFSEITDSGKVAQHNYAITITDATTIKLSSGTPTKTLTAAKLNDITTDETIIVSSDSNLADTNAFTAKTITILR